MDSIAKLYDVILCRRLESWFKPDREQAGAQRGRGCAEHILTLRMLFDFAKSKRKKLYVTFVDFSKAYDKVPRYALLSLLRTLGCGGVMVAAIATLYADTRFVLGAATILACVGVRQGSPTSCFLFTLYVNGIIRDLKEKCGTDGYLSLLHSLLLMDDTVLLSTTREGCFNKFKILVDFCRRSGMQINQSKTMFMVINGDEEDRHPIRTGDVEINNCSSYVYLGATFTQDGRLQSTLDKHCKEKQCHLWKFIAFISKNVDFPFWVKRKVFESAFLPAVLYSCDSWLGNCFAQVDTMYMTAIKVLLGVRKSTPNLMCLIEAGLPLLKSRVRAIQRKQFLKLIQERSRIPDDPFRNVVTGTSGTSSRTGPVRPKKTKKIF